MSDYGTFTNDALVAEIERLRADNATLRTALKNHGEEAAKLQSQFDAMCALIEIREGREERDKRLGLSAKMVNAEPVATAWMKDGKMVNAFPYPPNPDYNRDGYWDNKGYTQAPLFAAAPKPD